MSLDFKVDLRAKIIGDATLSGLIGTKCFPTVASQSAAAPYMTYHSISFSDGLCQEGADNTPKTRIQFDIYAKTPDQAETIRDRMKEVFHGFRGILDAGNSTEVLFSMMDDERDSDHVETESYHKQIDFIFRYRQS